MEGLFRCGKFAGIDAADANRQKRGVVGLALSCSFAGFCFGYRFADIISIEAAALSATLIGLILGRYLGCYESQYEDRA